MNVPIQPSSLPSWALTDEDVNQGLVKDIETLPTPITRPHQLSDWDEMSSAERFSASQVDSKPPVSQPIHPTESMFLSQARFEEPADWEGIRTPSSIDHSAATFKPNISPSTSSPPVSLSDTLFQKTPSGIAKSGVGSPQNQNTPASKSTLEARIRHENLRKEAALAEQQRLDMGMGWGSDSPPSHDKWLERQKKLDSIIDLTATKIGETVDEIPGFVMSLDLPRPQTAAVASSQKKNLKDLFKW